MGHLIKDTLPACVIIGLSFVVGPAAAGGMMGGSMMGGSMMDQGANGSSSQNEGLSSPTTRNLVGYVRSSSLTCLSCHNINSRSVGPAFLDIARRYEDNNDAQSALAGSIANGAAGRWTGYPAMPGGLASPSQAMKLAALILSLAAHSGH